MVTRVNILAPKIYLPFVPKASVNELQSILFAWLKNPGATLPLPFHVYITTSGQLFSKILGNHLLSKPLKVSGLYEIRFSEYQGKKLMHILDQHHEFRQNYELTVDPNGSLSIKPLTWWQYSHAEALKQRDYFISWLMEGGALPPERRFCIASNGNATLNIVNQNQMLLTTLGTERVAIGRFDEANGEKTIKIFEADARTLIKEYYFKNDPSGNWQIFAKSLSPFQEACLHGEKVRSWLINGGPPPPDRPIKINAHGEASLFILDGKMAALQALGRLERKGLARFYDADGKKHLTAFEKDGLTIINEYLFEKDSAGNWRIVPLALSAHQKALSHTKKIEDWFIDNKNVPEEREVNISAQGELHLKVRGKTLNLEALGRKKRAGIARFQEIAGEKSVAIYESDGKTLINEYLFYQNSEGDWQARPKQYSVKQAARSHMNKIKKWATGQAPPPQEYQRVIGSDGTIRLCELDKTKIALCALGARERVGLVRFRDVAGQKHIMVYEEAGDLLIREYHLQQTSEGTWQVTPVEASVQQEARTKGDLIRYWLNDKLGVPAEQKRSTGKYVIALCSIDGEQITLGNIRNNRRVILLRFFEVGEEKRVTVYETNGELIHSYLLAKGKTIYFLPPILEREELLEKVAALEKAVQAGKYQELIEQLPEDLRIDFLLMIFSKQFGEEVIAEYSSRLGKKPNVLGEKINNESVVKPTINPATAEAAAGEEKAAAANTSSERSENLPPKKPEKIVSPDNLLTLNKKKLEKLENALSISAFGSVEYEKILSIVQAKYLHDLLVEFKFDISLALVYARQRLAEVAGQQTLLFYALDWAAKYLDRQFTYNGLAQGVDLKPHQQLGVRFLLDHPQALLGDEMGSGKTLQALLAAVNSDCQKVLIICRMIGCGVWREEIESKLAETEDKRLVVIRSGKDLKIAGEKRFLIVNYEFARRHVAALQALSPDMVIIDEAHALCHEGSQQSIQLRELKAERKIAVTGTPLLNAASELWPILNFLLPEEFPQAENFSQNFTANMYQRALLNNRLRALMIRRKMGEYSLELPLLLEESVSVPMTEKQAAVYQELITDPVRWAFLHQVKFGRLKLVAWLVQAATDIGMLLHGKLGSLGEGGKYQKVQEIVTAAPEKRRIIFVRNISTMQHLNSLLNNSAIINQQTPHEERIVIINNFKRGELKTIIMSYQLGGESYNLPETDEIVLFDQAWNTPQKQQAIYRAYRLNREKKRPLRVISLISEDSIDEDIVALQNNKWQEFKEVVEGVKDKTLNQDKMEKLLEMSKRRRLAQLMEDEYLAELPQNLQSQEFIAALGRGDFEAVARYYKEHLTDLKAFWVAIARIGMMQKQQIPVWQNELTLGAGPSTLYEAWKKIKAAGLMKEIPTVVDLDQSPQMHQVAGNPQKYLLPMTRLAEVPGKFAVIGAEFSFYYVDPLERAEVIRQAWYKLQENGYLVLSGPNMIFDQEAVSAAEKLGFRVLTPPQEKVVSSPLLLEAAQALGKTVADVNRLIKNTGILLAQKTPVEPTEEEVYIPIIKVPKKSDSDRPISVGDRLSQLVETSLSPIETESISGLMTKQPETQFIEGEEATATPGSELIETRIMDGQGRIIKVYLPVSDPRVKHV